MAINSIKSFLKAESSGGIVLLTTLIIVFIIANSPLDPFYDAIIFYELPIQIGSYVSVQTLFTCVNDGLMTLFFLLLALDIKREMVVGELSHPKQVLLPVIAACGGVLVPALIYFAFVGVSDPVLARGWAIPVATDVALALGLLSLLSSRVPASLKIFLAVLAIADDLIAIIIIAVFYTSNISYLFIGLALAGIGILVLLNYFSVVRIGVYILVGAFIWLAVLESGVHPTLAGVAVGFCIPYVDNKNPNRFPLLILEHNLRPWVTFLVLPLFVFANAGVSIADNKLALTHPMPLGIAFGLFFGKQIGIFVASAIIIKSGFARLPTDSTWGGLYGIAALAGIGFTMSMFISNLAFRGTDFAVLSHLGILIGSACSAVVGLLILYMTSLRQR